MLIKFFRIFRKTTGRWARSRLKLKSAAHLPSISRFEEPWFIIMNEKEGLVDMFVFVFHCRVIHTTLWEFKKKSPGNDGRAFLFWNHKKIGQHYFHSKCLTVKIEFGIVFMFLYLLIHSLIHIFEKIGQHFTSTQSASPQHWSLNWFIKCIFR